jgi:4-alpha-glucanotransferase
MMDPDNQPEAAPLFAAGYRGSGMLLHVNSLPSPYGIGDVGPAAFDWVDRLQAAGQQWWQALTLGPAGYGNQPHQCSSSFAGNGLLISPDFLIQDELLRASDCEGHAFPATYIDYDAVIPFKQHMLHTAWANYRAGARRDLKVEFEQFCHENAYWLDDYALFRALKGKFGGAHYLEWPSDLVRRESAVLEQVRRELAAPVEKVSFAQFLLFRRGRSLKEYANARGVRVIGNLPFFVSPDSSDVWAKPEYFLLDETLRPRFVAGAPPDGFNSLGQTWGNPVYNWDALRETGYRWCIDRFRTAMAHVDVIRLDHFRGFAAAWHVPPGAPMARCGQWVQGPGARFFAAVQRDLGSLPFIAEDLGMITADVWQLLDQIEVPGIRVLQLAFDGHSDNPHLPDNYVANTLAYTGSHEHPTTRSWYEKLPPHERRNLWRYLRRPGGDAADAAPALMRLAWSSRAALAMAPLRDLLNLGQDARTDVPGNPAENMCWRATADMLHAPAFEWLRQLTKGTKRTGSASQPKLEEPKLEEIAMPKWFAGQNIGVTR